MPHVCLIRASTIPRSWIALGGALSAIGLLNTLMCTAARVAASSARLYVLPPSLGVVDEASGIPRRATIAIAILLMFACALPFSELVRLERDHSAPPPSPSPPRPSLSPAALSLAPPTPPSTQVSISMLFYGATTGFEFLALVTLRYREPSTPRPYRIPLSNQWMLGAAVPPLSLCVLLIFLAPREAVIFFFFSTLFATLTYFLAHGCDRQAVSPICEPLLRLRAHLSAQHGAQGRVFLGSSPPGYGAVRCCGLPLEAEASGAHAPVGHSLESTPRLQPSSPGDGREALVSEGGGGWGVGGSIGAARCCEDGISLEAFPQVRSSPVKSTQVNSGQLSVEAFPAGARPVPALARPMPTATGPTAATIPTATIPTPTVPTAAPAVIGSTYSAPSPCGSPPLASLSSALLSTPHAVPPGVARSSSARSSSAFSSGGVGGRLSAACNSSSAIGSRGALGSSEVCGGSSDEGGGSSRSGASSSRGGDDSSGPLLASDGGGSSSCGGDLMSRRCMPSLPPIGNADHLRATSPPAAEAYSLLPSPLGEERVASAAPDGRSPGDSARVRLLS